MTYLKIGIVFLLITFILGGAFFIGVVDSLRSVVSESNTGFISLLPAEALAILFLIMFVVVFSLAYAIFRE